MGSRGVREDRTDHTNLFNRSFRGFGRTGHQKIDFSGFVGFLGKSLHHRIPPKLSLETPDASKLMLGGPLGAPWALPDAPQIKFRSIDIHTK